MLSLERTKQRCMSESNELTPCSHPSRCDFAVTTAPRVFVFLFAADKKRLHTRAHQHINSCHVPLCFLRGAAKGLLSADLSSSLELNSSVSALLERSPLEFNSDAVEEIDALRVELAEVKQERSVVVVVVVMVVVMVVVVGEGEGCCCW